MQQGERGTRWESSRGPPTKRSASKFRTHPREQFFKWGGWGEDEMRCWISAIFNMKRNGFLRSAYLSLVGRYNGCSKPKPARVARPCRRWRPPAGLVCLRRRRQKKRCSSTATGVDSRAPATARESSTVSSWVPVGQNQVAEYLPRKTLKAQVTAAAAVEPLRYTTPSQGPSSGNNN